MKRNYFTYLLMTAIFMAGMVVSSCTKEGPAGPAGANGTDGVDGTNGVDGTTTCVECHDADQTISSKQFQWESSAHAAGTALSRSSSASCSGCHSQQGFMLTDGNNPETEDSWVGVSDPLLINCYACHPIHETYTGADVVNLNYSEQPNWAVTNGKEVDMDLGKGNLCAHCNQSRKREPTVDMNNLDAMYSGISTHFGPHYSSQSNVMGGFGAYELAGSATYPSSNSHANATNGCVSCHMGFDQASGTGGHNMSINSGSDLEKACVQCHSDGSMAKEKYDAYYHDYFATIDHGDDGNTVNTTSTYSMLGDLLVEHGVYTKVVDYEGDEPVDVHYNINGGLEINGTLTAAMFNHRFLYQDHSHGIHNPMYSRALLINSLEAVQALGK